MDDSLLSIAKDSRQNPFTSSPPQHTRTGTKGIGFHAHFLKHSDEKITKRSIVVAIVRDVAAMLQPSSC
jgi:hypothetical protein